MDAKKLIPLTTLLLLILAAAFVLGGCSALLPRFPTPVSMESIHTAAAKTVVAQATLSAGETAVAQLTQMASGGLPSPAGPTEINLTATWLALTPSASASLPPSATPPTERHADSYIHSHTANANPAYAHPPGVRAAHPGAAALRRGAVCHRRDRAGWHSLQPGGAVH
jgi:hypothetical protein